MLSRNDETTKKRRLVITDYDILIKKILSQSIIYNANSLKIQMVKINENQNIFIDLNYFKIEISLNNFPQIIKQKLLTFRLF